MATINLRVNVIFDSTSYQVALREDGTHFKTISGDFQPTDRTSSERFAKLNENVSSAVDHLIALRGRKLEDYTLNVEYQPVGNTRNLAVSLSPSS